MKTDALFSRRQEIRVGTSDRRQYWGKHSIELKHPTSPSELTESTVEGSLEDRVLLSATGLEVYSYQEFGYVFSIEKGVVTEVIKKDDREAKYKVRELAPLLFRAGVSSEILHAGNSKPATETGTLYLLLQRSVDKWSVLGGGPITSDFVDRDGDVSFAVTFGDEQVARDFYESTKTEPNSTLDRVIHYIVDSAGPDKAYISKANIRSEPREYLNPFAKPIKRVVSGELVG